ncbi:MAG: hypothetical protein H0V66_10785 [Bdellovibrionales bacterium]|nr:hypothetical protein [Bdellovibrionales bacterium]
MSDKDFVSFLVDETLKLQKSGEADLSSLELKLTDYGLNFLKGEFIPQTQILRFQTPFGNLDVPVNWSVFSMENSLAQYTLLDEKNDVDNFFVVIKAAWKQSIEKLLITHDDGFCYIVGLKQGEEVHLHDLVNPQVWLKSA